MPLFADHEAISELLGGVGEIASGEEQPKGRARFLSLDVTGSQSQNPFSKRSPSTPRQLTEPRPLGKKITLKILVMLILNV